MMVEGSQLAVDELADRCVLIVHSDTSPPDPELDQLMRVWNARKARMDKMCCLVVTDGGSPTPAQRKRLLEAFGKPWSSMPLAVISDSATIRFVSTALFFVARN